MLAEINHRQIILRQERIKYFNSQKNKFEKLVKKAKDAINDDQSSVIERKELKVLSANSISISQDRVGLGVSAHLSVRCIRKVGGLFSSKYAYIYLYHASISCSESYPFLRPSINYVLNGNKISDAEDVTIGLIRNEVSLREALANFAGTPESDLIYRNQFFIANGMIKNQF